MTIDSRYCPRCGMHKGYHSKKDLGEHVILCIRKKPYKLRDGAEVRLGMQVWQWWPFSREYTIITGMVRFISKFGGLTLWKYPEDRDPSSPFNLSHDGRYTASFSCFSTLEKAQSFMAKEKARREKLCKNIAPLV